MANTKEEFTLDAYVKKEKTTETHDTSKNWKNKIDKKFNGIKKAGSESFRRNDRSDNNRFGGVNSKLITLIIHFGPTHQQQQIC